MAQLKALYANEPKQLSEAKGSIIFDVRRAFAEVDTADGNVVWIEALPAKTWHTMQWGEVAVTPDKLARFQENFKNNIRGQQIGIDYEHGLDPAKGTKASGWIRDVEVRDNSLWAGIEFTENARKEIKDKEWKYFSLEWDDLYQSSTDGKMYEDVIVGGGLTNRPIAKGMMPINFSEVFIESAEGEEAKTLSEVLDEVADLEHSEPGSGNPPQPREKEDDDIAIDTGSRRDPLPIETEDSVMTDEQLKALRELFGITDDDADADAVVAKAKDIVGERTQFSERATALETELTEVKAKLPEDEQAKKKFAEQYPDEHKRMVELERVNRENSAKSFSESIQRYTKTEGDKTEVTQFGLSGLALQTVEEAHKKFSEGNGSLADFEGAIKSLVNNGIVDYGERGSSLQNETPEVDHSGTPAGVQNNRMRFAELVNKKQEDARAKDEELTFDDAVRIVTRENPELAKLYRQSVPA